MGQAGCDVQVDSWEGRNGKVAVARMRVFNIVPSMA